MHQLVLPGTSAFGEEVNGKRPFRPYVQMLANNNVSAGRVVTKMEFDINSSTPKLLFSAVSAVDDDIKPIIMRQSKSQAAENAVKLTVYQTDAATDDVAQEEISEPKVRDVKKPTLEKAEDVSNIVKKWTKK